jgi:hemoglobin-like flavoprotein
MDTADLTHVRHVRSSWQKVQAIAPAAAALFYENLFAAQPQLRALFRGDMVQQGERLMRMLGAAVAGLDAPAAFVPVLQQLAVRHVGYGVRDEHYDTVGAALLKTLAQGLGEDFTPQVREAWTRTYGLIASTMREAARQAAPRPTGLPARNAAMRASSAC